MTRAPGLCRGSGGCRPAPAARRCGETPRGTCSGGPSVLLLGCCQVWRCPASGGHFTIALPFGTGRTSPVAVDDVARVVATVLRDPAPHIGHVYELTGPQSVTMPELAAAFSRALDRS